MSMFRLLSFILLLPLAVATGAAAKGEFRVCANPQNLPFSNMRGEGFENKLAELVAHVLQERVAYTWTLEREHFVRKTLNAGKCDVLMGVPAGFSEVDTTHPYYASGYVFVSRADRRLNLVSMRDPRLRRMKIGVHVIGDDDTPPLVALARQGITQNVVGYMIYRDTLVQEHSQLIDDLAAGKLDVAAVWGPFGGYFAQRSNVRLTVTPIGDTASFAPALFQYRIAMGVRKGDAALRNRLDGVIADYGSRIRALLKAYGVPVFGQGRASKEGEKNAQ